MSEKLFSKEFSDGYSPSRAEYDLSLEEAIEAVMYYDEQLLYKKDRNFIQIMIDSLQVRGYLDFGRNDQAGYIIVRRTK
jgi:hypothetical protein